MNNNQNKSNSHKIWTVFYPLVLFFAVRIIISVLFEIIISFKIMQQYPNLEMLDLYNKIMEYFAAANSKLMIVTSAVTIIAGGILFFRNDYKDFDKKYQNKIGLKDFAAAFSLSAGFYMLICIVYIIALSYVNFNEYNTSMNTLFSGNLFIDIFTLGIITPICEELIFRGLTFNRMRSIMKESNAMFFSALIFAVMHMEGFQIFYALILGLILSYAYVKYENIIMPIIIHMLFNLMNFIFLFLPDITTTKIGSLIFYGLCILFTYFGVKVMLKKAKPSLKL